MKNNTMIPYNPKKDLETNYYNKTEVELLVAGGSGGSIDLSNYYKKLETYSKAQVDALVAGGGADLSDYYTKAEVDGLLDSISLDDYYTKTQTEVLLSNKVEKEDGKGLSTNDFTNTFKQAYDGHLASTSNPHNVTALQVGAYSKSENDNLLIKKANLDINNKIPLSEIPDSILGQLKYMGVWDFSSGLPTGAQKGNYWITSVSGNGYEVGDWAVYNGTSFDKVDNTDAVSSVAGRTGNVVLNKNDVGLNNVDNTSDLNKPISTATQTALDTKQDNLVSGTNIKTINGQSVLGSGNIVITGGGSGGEVDLSNYYTKPQVDGFINEIYAEIGSPIIIGEAPYGIRWNQETDVYEVLGATNRTQIQENMKRCVLRDNGTLNYYLNPTNSTQKKDGTPAVLTGADGNVMVEVPKFWYKHTLVGDTHEWWVSNTPLEGYSVHPWFLEGGVERPFRYYRAYTPTVVAGKLRSISGSTPTRSQTRNTFRTQAIANGTGWGLCSWNAVNAIQLLFLTEYCTFNTQAILGTGNSAGSGWGMTTGQSNSIGNASSGATNNNTWISYRGIENWYADCWEFIDGINIQNYKVFLNQNPATFADTVFTGDYIDSGVTIPAGMSSSYIKKISGNFLPTAVGGSSSTFVTDGGFSSSAGTLLIFGGTANVGLVAGGFTFAGEHSAAISAASVSAGLSR